MDARLPASSINVEVTLSVEGVYDYFCIPHEQSGLAGRIIVGKAIGHGAQPFDYFTGMLQTSDWLSVPLSCAEGLSIGRDNLEREDGSPNERAA